MNLILLLALLVGTQIGLSDGLILPTLVADHGQGSFLAVYTVLKLLFILPVLQAELVAGRLYRVTPFEFSFSILNKTTTRVLFGILLTAIILVMATNLFNTSWALMFGFDGLQGDLLSLKPLDQNLYWFAQNQDISRIMILVVVQGVLLVMLGGLAWRVIAAIFLAVVPLVALFIVLSLPSAEGACARVCGPRTLGRETPTYSFQLRRTRQMRNARRRSDLEGETTRGITRFIYNFW